MKNIMLIYILLAISNILSIVFGSILILKNKLRINSGFYQMNNPEKTENSIDGPFKPSKNDLAESEQKSDNKIIKVKNVISDANINIINQNKFNNENDPGTNKDGKISYNKNGLTKIDGGVSLQVFQPNNQNIIFNIGNNRNEISQSKDLQFCIIQTLININDGLNLIWTLIVLYNRFEEKCLSTSIYLSLLKLLGEVVLFPINQYITKNSSISLFLKIIPKRMKIINIFLLCSSILISQTIFSIYYYSNISDLLMKLFFLPLFLRNILSGILYDDGDNYCHYLISLSKYSNLDVDYLMTGYKKKEFFDLYFRIFKKYVSNFDKLNKFLNSMDKLNPFNLFNYFYKTPYISRDEIENLTSEYVKNVIKTEYYLDALNIYYNSFVPKIIKLDYLKVLFDRNHVPKFNKYRNSKTLFVKYKIDDLYYLRSYCGRLKIPVVNFRGIEPYMRFCLRKCNIKDFKIDVNNINSYDDIKEVEKYKPKK